MNGGEPIVTRRKARTGPIQYDRGAHVMPKASELRAERGLVALLAAVFLHRMTFRGGTFVYLFHKATTGVWVDEGARVAAGETMYRDFADVVGPGIVYLNAAVLGLFGARLDALAFSGIAVGVAVALALHAVTARVAGRAARILAPVLCVVLVYARGRDFGGPAWPALALILAGLLSLLKGPASLVRACVAGVAVGLASLFQVEMGVGAALGVAAHLIRQERGKERVSVAFGLACLALPALAFTLFSIAASPATVLEWWLIRPWRQRLAEFQMDAGHAWGVPLASWIVLAAGGAACAALALRRGRAEEEDGLRLCAWTGLGVLLAPAVAHVDAYTLAVQSTVLLPVLAAALAPAERPRATPAWAARAAAAAVLALGLAHGAVLLAGWPHDPVRVAQRFRAGTAWLGAPARDLEWIERNAAPGEPIFAFPAAGMFYFLTGTRNATSFPAMVEGRWSDEEQRRALGEIEAARPAIGVWLGAQRIRPPAGAASLDPLYEGILRLYQVEGTLPEGTLLLRRRSGAGP